MAIFNQFVRRFYIDTFIHMKYKRLLDSETRQRKTPLWAFSFETMKTVIAEKNSYQPSIANYVEMVDVDTEIKLLVLIKTVVY